MGLNEIMNITLKNNNKKKFQLELRDQKGELSHPGTIVEPNRKNKESFSLLARTRPMKTRGLYLLQASQFPFPLNKNVPSLGVGKTWQ